MRTIQGIQLDSQTREEQLPGFAADFPYIATCAELSRYSEPFVPWHWHQAVELFYMEQGRLEYETAGGTWSFVQGDGGFVNSNVLHRSRVLTGEGPTVQTLHLFDPALVTGQQGGRVHQKYFLPMLADPALELLPLRPEVPAQAKLLGLIQDAFHIPEQETGYEIELQRALLEIWLLLYRQYTASANAREGKSRNVEAVKVMMVYVWEHYSQPLSVKALANAAYLSQRECYRVFRDCLHTTPADYITRYRMQEVCKALAGSQRSVTEIAHACGFGSGSYLGKLFLRQLGCTPRQYREHWQDITKISRD